MEPHQTARALAAAAIAIAALGSSISPAQGANGGLVYKVSKAKALPAGEQASAKANCPDDTSVVGGGLEINEGNTATGMHSSLPFDDGDGNAIPDDGWLGVANSRSAGDKSMLTLAVCSRTGRFSYVAGTPELLSNNSRERAEAPCPAGQSVVGGGLGLTQGGAETLYTAAETFPIDLPSDLDAITDDGWRAAANNQSGIDQALTAHAICARAGAYRYRAVKVDAPAGAQTERRARCPRGTGLTAGGVDARTLGLGGEVAASLPVAGGGMMGKNTWLGAINSNSPVGAELRVYAICRKT